MATRKKRTKARSPEAKEQRRREIIHAAIELYVRKGFFAGSMNDLARGTGIAKGTLYVYFKSKEALWNAIIELLAEEMDGLIQTIFASTDPPLAKLESIARFSFDYYAENTKLCDIMIKIWAMTDTEHETPLRTTLRAMYEQYRRALAAIIREGIERGEIRPDPDPVASASFVLAMLDGLIVQWLMEPDLFDPASCMDTFRRVCVDGLAPRK